jgi:SNF2 family DNA or RNA helicase
MRATILSSCLARSHLQIVRLADTMEPGVSQLVLGQPMVDRFNNDPEKFVFLISTMTGGVGLNLTSANRVVIFGKLSLVEPQLC